MKPLAPTDRHRPNACRIAGAMRPTRSRSVRSARGLAVILALVAVATAVLIGLTIASTRDATVSTGGGIVRAAQSRAAAAGSIDLALRLLDEPAVLGHSDGGAGPLVLFGETAIGGGRYSASVRDLATLQRPTDATLALEIQASGAFDGTVHSARALGRLLRPEMVAQADLDLSEFALIATGAPGVDPAISIANHSDIAAWSASPLSTLGEPLFIATADRNPNGVACCGTSRLKGHVVVEEGEFDLDRATYDEALAEKRFAMPADIHVPMPPVPQVSRSSKLIRLAAGADLEPLQAELDGALPNLPDDVVNTGNPLAVDARIVPPSNRLEIASGHGLRIQANDDTGPLPPGVWRVIEVSGDLVLSGGWLHAFVPTMLIVRGDLEIDEGRITVEPGAPSLAIYVAGNISLRNGARVGPGAFSGVTPLNPYELGGPSKVAIYAMPQPDPNALTSISINGGSEVTGQLYAPRSTLSAAESRFNGSIAAATILFNNVVFRYDPALNSGLGWTNPYSGIWVDASTPRPEIAAVDILDDLGLAMFSMMAGVATRMPDCGMLATIHVDAQGSDDTSTREVKRNGGSSDQLAYWIRKPSSRNGVTAGIKACAAHAGLGDSLHVHAIMRDFRLHSEARGHPNFGAELKELHPDDRLVGLMHENLILKGGDLPTALGSAQPPLVARGNWLDNLGDPTTRFVTDVTKGTPPTSVQLAADLGVKAPTANEVASWFADPPGSAREVLTLDVRRTTDNTGKDYFIYDSTFDPFPLVDDPTATVTDGGFFPIDRKLFGNGRDTGFNARNHGFTAEIHAHFLYQPGNGTTGSGQMLSIESNNEVWVYLRTTEGAATPWSQLVIDLGFKREAGSNAIQWQIVDLDSLAQTLDLQAGQEYALSIYVAHRRKGDSYLRLASSFKFWSPELPDSSNPLECEHVIGMVRDMIENKSDDGEFGTRRPEVPSDLGRYRIRMTGAAR